MKKTGFLSILLLIFLSIFTFLFIFNPNINKVSAQTYTNCDSFTLSPTQGNSNTSFHIQATNCTFSTPAPDLRVVIWVSNNNVYSTQVTINVPDTSNVDTLFQGSTFPNTGNYIVGIGIPDTNNPGEFTPASCGAGSLCRAQVVISNSQITCEWNVRTPSCSGCPTTPQPVMDLHGFSSAQEGANSYVRFNCVSNCGGVGAQFFNQIFGVQTQVFSLSGFTFPSESGGTFWTGISGYWDQSLINVLNSNTQLTSVCGTITNIASYASSLVPGVGLGTIFVAPTASSILSSACQTILGGNAMVIHGAVGTYSGNTFSEIQGCNLTLNYANGGIIPVLTPGSIGGTPYNRPAAYCNTANPSGGLSVTPTEYVYTAIGCIRVSDWLQITRTILLLGAGVAGGIAALLLFYGAFLVITSGGNPQRLQAGKELITAAIMGLLLLLFGAFVLRLIGVTILRIPGFGT